MSCTSLIKIRVGPLPAAAVAFGFVRNPITYDSFGKYTAKAGAKKQQPEMSEFEALRELLSTQLIKLLRARAAAYFAEKDAHEEYHPDGMWRYWAAVIAHGVVKYSREKDAYVAEQSSGHGLLGNTFLRELHTLAQWQHAKQAWTAPRDALTAHFNRKARELWVPTQYDYTQLITISSHSFFVFLSNHLSRKQAIDEGGIPTFANVAEQKYTPGKPHRNAVEFIASVGSDLWLSNMMWSADKRPKYGMPEKKLHQMLAYVHYFKKYHAPRLQPHIFYIDARWSSLALMDRIAKARCYGVLSCSVSMKPRALIPWMKNDIPKGDWWSIGYRPARANLITIRTKKKVYLNLLTNYAKLEPVKTKKEQRKYPRRKYDVRIPFVQKHYNKYKCSVDKWNRSLLKYYRLGFFVNKDVMYTTFFIHAYTLQSWIYWQAVTGKKCSQLSFRKSLLQQLRAHLFPQPPEQALLVHYPRSMAPHSQHCQFCRSRSRCSYKCYACNKWGCLSCLEKAHFG